MLRNSEKTLVLSIILLLLTMIFAGIVRAHEEVDIDSHFLMEDEDGNLITMAGRELSIGDIFIDSGNRAYKVKSVKGRKAVAEFLEVVDLKKPSRGRVEAFLDRISALFGDNRRDMAAIDKSRPIAIYHTHSDESYIPTSGTSSKEWGDVYHVGKVLTQNLKKQGYEVSYSTNNHNPHDGAAYDRSRATALSLMRQRPAALIDVHRDAVPPEVYTATVNGRKIAQIRLIIGKQNQNNSANLDFAKAIKAAADQKYPGLINGILWANGDYNQDLSPRSVLFEVGSHTTSLAMAEEGISMLSEVLPAAIYGEGADQMSRPRAFGTVGKSIAWIIGIAVLLGGGFLLINTKGLKGLTGRLKQTISTEFSSAIGVEKEDEGMEEEDEEMAEDEGTEKDEDTAEDEDAEGDESIAEDADPEENDADADEADEPLDETSDGNRDEPLGGSDADGNDG